MKIGIMTFPNSTSYGATLQMYALYRAVERCGADAEIINYYSPYMKSGLHLSAVNQHSSLMGRLRLLTSRLLHLRQITDFRRFEKKMFRFPRRHTDRADLLEHIADRYSGVVCGSDQVWNPHITNTDLSYFLNFCGSKIRRIAYAPSFGIAEFPEDFAEIIRPELERFAYLSVREESGKAFLEQLLGREACLVLDPTFLVDVQEWITIEKKRRLPKDAYILYFPVRKSDELFRFSLELAKKRNAKMVVIGGNLLHQLRNKDPRISYALDPSPEEWLYLVHNAQCVVTNSFHGTAFSIHYQKDFYLEMSSKTNSRLEQLIGLTGLEDRVVREGCADWNKHIDYGPVQERLAPARKVSLRYLEQAVRNEEG